MTKCETELANLKLANLNSSARELLRELDYLIFPGLKPHPSGRILSDPTLTSRVLAGRRLPSPITSGVPSVPITSSVTWFSRIRRLSGGPSNAR